jgi:hypothetical protein
VNVVEEEKNGFTTLFAQHTKKAATKIIHSWHQQLEKYIDNKVHPWLRGRFGRKRKENGFDVSNWFESRGAGFHDGKGSVTAKFR